ncbi:hypothetical protein [Hymenobacter fodinae]|uniref:Uncharacterized protein n=1 Tax=Hymenobacter fodinae TaxID=2510796 RepID=A0A4Z0P0X8_9BACT|nr:hypothetical protein [Hymenobacter fodinae]TGE03314.1 hypothetical protein EU556_25700 [Hymenobacter fodinae]
MVHRRPVARPNARKTYRAHEHVLTITLHPHLLRTGLVPSRYPAIEYTLQPIAGSTVPTRTRTAVHWYPTLASARQAFEALQPHECQSLLAGVLHHLPRHAVASGTSSS